MASPAQTQEVDIPIEGMTCATCVSRVERALASTAGVEHANVNLVTKRASVRFDPSRATKDAMGRAIEDAGYHVGVAEPVEAPDRESRARGRDAAIAGALAVPLVAFGMMNLMSSAAHFVELALATALLVGPGRTFFVAAFRAARHASADMNTLVALGAGAAWVYSTVAIAMAPAGMPRVYYEAAGAIVAFVLLGRWLESRARRRLGDAVRGLVALRPATARVLRNENEVETIVDALEIGDRVRVRPGERVPADGEVERGGASVDESMLTGESAPVAKLAGSPVFGGTLDQDGELVVRVTRAQSDSALARIVQALEQAQGSKAPIARLADRVSGVFAIAVLAIATVTLLVWIAIGAGAPVALERFVAVLVIACPCALGLATPAAIAVGTGRGAELGVLVKGGEALEAASHVDLVLLDKTGTLTTGEPRVVSIAAYEGKEEDVLALAASAELPSEHPVGRAIVAAARARGLELASPDSFRAEPGGGVVARVRGRDVRIGTARHLEGLERARAERDAESFAARGETPTLVAADGRVIAVIGVRDEPADGAAAAMQRLVAMGIGVAIVSGDRAPVVEAIARELAVDASKTIRTFAEVRPEDKARIVREERAKGHVVAMVGDGINDAPALATADVGVTVARAADVAAAASDLALVSGSIETLPTALALARATFRTIRENLFWAFVYNVVGIPIAAGALYPFTGWQLSPILASAAMSLSSVSVLLNSLRLRRFA
ncbi:MAG TPA: heavy metal translocating P-type ATPase [Polyangiaceae bacterium]